MNRRVRNRTHGGVGGRRGQPRLLPDPVEKMRFLRHRILHLVSRRMPVSEANRIAAGWRRYQETSGLYQTFMLSRSPEIWVLRVNVPPKS